MPEFDAHSNDIPLGEWELPPPLDDDFDTLNTGAQPYGHVPCYDIGIFPDQADATGSSYDYIDPADIKKFMDRFDAGEKSTTPEECLAALIDLKQTVDYGPAGAQGAHAFYDVLGKDKAPSDLRTDIHTLTPDDPSWDGTRYAPGADVVSEVMVMFDSNMLGVYEVGTYSVVNGTDGMEVHEAVLVDRADGSELRLTRQLSGAEIAALQADARTIYQKKMDQGAEILQLGPLTEEPREDGVQRFHASEVLSVMADGWYTARGYDGIDAVLEYMTGDTVVNTQRIRFAEECIPALQERYGELLTPYADRFAGNPELSLRDVYGALGELKETLGSVFLEVPKLTSEQHTVMDPLTELKLDVGEERVMPPLDPNAED